MDELAILVDGTDRRKVDGLVESLRASVTQVSSIRVVQSEGFIGTPEFTIAISVSVGLGVIAKHLAQVIVAWIKRYDARSVKVGKIEIKGYPIKEVERILKANRGSPKRL